MEKFIFGISIVLISFFSTGQILEFDQLEMRYDQQQYSVVYKKAKKLMDNPEYDFSFLPRYYLAISELQLAQNKRWLKKNKYAIEDARKILMDIQASKEGTRLLQAHFYELTILKNDLTLWYYQLKQEGDDKTANTIEQFISDFFLKIPEFSAAEEKQVKEITYMPEELKTVEDIEKSKEELALIASPRQEILEVSEKLLGVPYKWAGTTPKGFDCSGFTCYVMENSVAINVSHRSADQYREAKKIKEKDTKPGDLVFFSNGGNINHVGIIYSKHNNSIQMIHASTSVGVSIVDIYQSDYWKKRIKGFGTFLKD